MRRVSRTLLVSAKRNGRKCRKAENGFSFLANVFSDRERIAYQRPRFAQAADKGGVNEIKGESDQASTPRGDFVLLAGHFRRRDRFRERGRLQFRAARRGPR